jgi:UDP-hydrolysing UDP-N-acetyl-D-glucosamine 2-epimerase
MKRKICVVTGTRADYGLLRWVLEGLRDAEEVDLRIAATGMHLSPAHGATIEAIEADGFRVDERVDMLLAADTPVATGKAIGLGVIGFADALNRIDPDLVVVLGDRFEMWAAAQAAFVQRRILAHIHGGETTVGAFDEGIRHSLTKLSHYHFVAAEPYRRRVIQMGESPDRVFTVGAPGLDHLSRTPLLDRETLASELGCSLASPLFAVTLHPTTFGRQDAAASAAALIEALERFPEAQIVITEANADPGGQVINRRLRAYAEQRDRAVMFTSLGQQRYLSLLRAADVVVGNSSSGLLEAPAFETPTVNIGSRQDGRLRARSVLDCAAAPDAIAEAIDRALEPEFRTALAGMDAPYGRGGASARIIAHLMQVPMEAGTVRKEFYDVPAPTGLSEV